MSGPVGMMSPNWVDNQYGPAMESMSAEDALETLAKDTRVIRAVQDALNQRDADIAAAKVINKTWAGPSRSQKIRQTLAEVIMA